MPLIRFLASKRHTYIIAVILLLGEIMLIYSYYTKKKLVCIIIMAFFSRQPSSYIKYTKLNIRLSCNIRLVFDMECLYFIHLCSL